MSIHTPNAAQTIKKISTTPTIGWHAPDFAIYHCITLRLIGVWWFSVVDHSVYSLVSSSSIPQSNNRIYPCPCTHDDLGMHL